jgi:hypothetical protein
MNEMGTSTYRTELKEYPEPDESGDPLETVMTGSWRHTGGISASMHARRGAFGMLHDIGDAIIVPGELYLTYPEKDVWYGYAEQDDQVKFHSQFIGHRVPMTVATELDYLAPGAATIVGSARDDVDGKPATRYDVTADPAKMAPLVQDRLRRAELKTMAEQHGTITVSVWVDDTGLPLKATSMESTPHLRSTTWFENWGKPVTITVPPADLITWR